MSEVGSVAGGTFCRGCGKPVVQSAIVCPNCGSAVHGSVGSGKSKTTALLLAIFLGFWTWLYTYKKDAAKFWIGFGVNMTFGLLLWFVLMGWLVWFGIAVWALIDVATKDESYYLDA